VSLMTTSADSRGKGVCVFIFVKSPIDDADTNASSNMRLRSMVELGISLDAVPGVPRKLGESTPLE
ncbi:hypothetical protein, partial [Stenomitos frigidus]|uniref:hypothetical protein n=1 Tax=Stenomitos frigidus TaxID=1886765 RepID=UPI001C631F65